jgi:hypothetical protein
MTTAMLAKFYGALVDSAPSVMQALELEASQCRTSSSAIEDPGHAVTKPSRYVDATKIPYIVDEVNAVGISPDISECPTWTAMNSCGEFAPGAQRFRRSK